MNDPIADYWSWCAERGVVSKRLSIRFTGHQLSVHAGEALRAGAVVAAVPYMSVLNVETVLGDARPAAMPSPRALCAFLTRRGRMDMAAARALWLSGSVACWLSGASGASGLSGLSGASGAFGASVRPLLALAPPGRPLRDAEAEAAAERQRRVAHAAIQFHRRRQRAPIDLCPSLAQLRAAHRVVLERAVMLPANCAPSAPGDVAELFSTRPDTEVVPSLVPVVGLIRGGAADSNCALYTCIQSEFVSPNSRRRVIVETAPLAARRVVLCATKDMKEGDEIRMEFE